jgi:hypothetical protein
MEERFFDGGFHHSWEMYAAAPDDVNMPLPEAV